MMGEEEHLLAFRTTCTSLPNQTGRCRAFWSSWTYAIQMLDQGLPTVSRAIVG